MTLAAAERNDIRGTVSSEADFRSDTYSGTKFNPLLSQYCCGATNKNLQ